MRSPYQSASFEATTSHWPSGSSKHPRGCTGPPGTTKECAEGSAFWLCAAVHDFRNSTHGLGIQYTKACALRSAQTALFSNTRLLLGPAFSLLMKSSAAEYLAAPRLLAMRKLRLCCVTVETIEIIWRCSKNSGGKAFPARQGRP